MKLKNLILEQFRNYRNLELDFDPEEPMTYIVGPNAQGKTNILESIYLLALTKSFRTARQQDMIGWEHEFARVRGIFDADPEPESQKTLELEAFLGKPPQPQKSFKKNGVKTGAANFIGNCQVVFFHPEDLNMLYLGPDLRRAYLNVMNVQVNRKYFSALRSYHKVLKQRNALLHAIRENRAARSELDVWDEQLVEHGSYIMAERSNTLKYFQTRLAFTYRKISQGEEIVKLSYCHTLRSLNDRLNDPGTPPADTAETWRAYFANDLAAARHRDLQALVTTVGPHRDDIGFSFNGLQLAAHASRGEYRSLLLALKLIELDFFEDHTGQNPILLLDDVFSELDPRRQNLLLQAIEGHQTIVTTTHMSEDLPLRDHHSLKASTAVVSTKRPGKYLEVNSGKITENMV